MLVVPVAVLLVARGGLLSLAAPTEGLAKRAPTASGTFNVLSMNVAGLPEILNGNGQSGDKTTNTMLIGQDFAKYNYGVVHDFNYHATLYQYDTHPYRTATSGGVPFGSGLNTIANYPWIDFARIKWDTCSNASENYVSANSIGNAVVVYGDTNSRYTRAQDNIRLLTTQNGMTDAWVQAIGGGAFAAGADALLCPTGVPTDIKCEVVDKVFFRGSKFITLTSRGFYYDTARFLSTDLATLTDHNPVRVEFAWNLPSNLRQSDLYGGPHGTWFNDLPSLPTSPKAASITLRGASRLDGLSITLTSGATFNHGGIGGAASTLKLSSGERITSVKPCWGTYNS
ncbi:hypothetical protein FRC07_009939 [Ceratobasidium sp. 392]|nr:hypothetical protein FRC07_009939 [Ceratobasidium sp. 392]